LIISIRGTSGTGKTTLARRVLFDEGVYGPARQVYKERRRVPLYYVREALAPGRRGIAILGSYENTTGGCDTISGNDIPFEMMRVIHDSYDCFFEGLLMSAEQHRTAKLHRDGYPVHLFYLNLSLEECLRSVEIRRAARGVTAPLNPKTTASRHSALRHHPPRFLAMGVNVGVGDRLAAERWLRGLGVLPPIEEETK